jgi:SAM-dependent methyltransferase
VVVKERAEAHPEDYHDYVFAKGKLVGKFDEMYRYAKGVPWDQDKRCNDWYAEVGLLMLADNAPYPSILEMGCGLGYITAKLKQRMSPPGGVIHGFDVSAEAVRRASAMHEGIDFWVDDVRRADFAPRQQYDLVVVRDVFWYVFDSMPLVIANIAKSVRAGGTLYVGQSFPALDRPFVGKEVIPDPDGLLRYFEPWFRLIHSMRLRRHRVEADGPILHFIAERKG